jgi:hypothetical protein
MPHQPPAHHEMSKRDSSNKIKIKEKQNKTKQTIPISSNLSTARPPSTRPVRPSLVLYTKSPTPATVLITARHAAPTTFTPRDNQTRFSKRNKDKIKIKQTIPDLNSNITKSMTHQNQTKELTTWFLKLVGCQPLPLSQLNINQS